MLLYNLAEEPWIIMIDLNINLRLFAQCGYEGVINFFFIGAHFLRIMSTFKRPGDTPLTKFPFPGTASR
jgi:hypothetical protein